MRELPIVFATDMKYMKPTCIAMESVLLASENKETYYHFYVLMPFDETDSATDFFLQMQRKYMFCTIQVIGVGNVFDNAYIRIKRITLPTYYRLLLPELIENEKCIYLDSDIITCCDLSELYDIDIDGYDLGGVIAPTYVLDKSHAEKIGIPNTNEYINAGVLLLNLAQMRADKFVDRALELIEQPFPVQDQDIINRVAFHRIKLLPYKYNVQVARKRYLNILSDEERKEAEVNPVILHYSYSEKPWECMNIEHADRWWKICRNSFLFESFLEEQKNSLFYYSVVCNFSLWKLEKYSSEWLDELRKYTKCYVYGAGKVGGKAISYLKDNHIPIAGILVTELEENREYVQGIRVNRFTEDVEEDALILLAVSEASQIIIRRQLFRCGRFYVMPFHELYYGMY